MWRHFLSQNLIRASIVCIVTLIIYFMVFSPGSHDELIRKPATRVASDLVIKETGKNYYVRRKFKMFRPGEEEPVPSYSDLADGKTVISAGTNDVISAGDTKHSMTGESKTRGNAENDHGKQDIENVMVNAENAQEISYVNTSLPGLRAPLMIALMPYMRGGSSFLGEIFNQLPGSFYLFEPVDSVYSDMYHTDANWHPFDIYYNRGGGRRDIPVEEHHRVAKVIRDMMSCHVTELPVDLLLSHALFSRPHNALSPYVRCLKSRNVTGEHVIQCRVKTSGYCGRYFVGGVQSCSNMNSTSDSILTDKIQEKFECFNSLLNRSRSCIHIYERACTNTSVRVTKNLRLMFSTAEILLKQEANIKFIYQLRDPRGILHSRFKLNFLNEMYAGNMEGEAYHLCDKMVDDIKSFKQLKEKYPESFYMLRYEDLAESPLFTVNKMFRFLNIKLEQKLSTWLNETTRAPSNDHWYGTRRKNSTETAWHWRADMDTDTFQALTDICKDAIPKLGYKI